MERRTACRGARLSRHRRGARQHLRAGRPAGAGADHDHHAGRRADRRRGQGQDQGRQGHGRLPRHAGDGHGLRHHPGRCRRSSACTPTSPTCAGASPRPATTPSRRSSISARAIPRPITEIPTLISELVSKVPDAQVMGDLDSDRRLRQERGQGRHRQARHHRLLLGRPHRLDLRLRTIRR